MLMPGVSSIYEVPSGDPTVETNFPVHITYTFPVRECRVGSTAGTTPSLLPDSQRPPGLNIQYYIQCNVIAANAEILQPMQRHCS